jgi:hypothetical protein
VTVCFAGRGGGALLALSGAPFFLAIECFRKRGWPRVQLDDEYVRGGGARDEFNIVPPVREYISNLYLDVVKQFVEKSGDPHAIMDGAEAGREFHRIWARWPSVCERTAAVGRGGRPVVLLPRRCSAPPRLRVRGCASASQRLCNDGLV